MKGMICLDWAARSLIGLGGAPLTHDHSLIPYYLAFVFVSEREGAKGKRIMEPIFDVAVNLSFSFRTPSTEEL